MSLLNTGIQAFLQNKQLNNNMALGIAGLRLEKDKIDGLQRLSELQARLSAIKTKTDLEKNNYLAKDSINAFEDSFNTAYTSYLKDTNQEDNDETYNKFKEYYRYDDQKKAYNDNVADYEKINTNYSTEIENLLDSYLGVVDANEVKPAPVPEPSVSPYKINNNINSMSFIDNIVGKPKVKRWLVDPDSFINNYNNQSIIKPSPFFDYVKNKNLWRDNGKPRF